MATSETRRMLLAATAACEEKKAEDIRVLELDPVDSAFTDFFLICSGTNSRQNQAIAQEIELRLKHEFGMYANSVEGYRQAEWILLDYVDFVVHIFTADKRAFYDIERLRKSASSVALEELKKSLVKKIAAVRKKAAPEKKAAAKKAPAKPAAKSTVKTSATKPRADAKKAAKKATPSAKPKKAAAKKSIAGKASAKKVVKATKPRKK